MNRILFSSITPHWTTPIEFYEELNEKFKFNFDPCPIGGKDGLKIEWRERNYINPPYGKEISNWLLKGILESQKGKLCVFLLPVRTDTKWFHNLVLPFAKEILFIKGRLKFGKSKNSAPFPSMVIIFEGVR